MIINKSVFNLVLCSLLMAPVASSASEATGKGSAVIEADIQTTESKAKQMAKEDLVVDAIANLIGMDKQEVRKKYKTKIPDLVDNFKIFVIGNPEEDADRDGASFKVEYKANINDEKFRAKLKSLGIGLSGLAQKAGIITIFFDEVEKPFNQPSEMYNESFEYNRDNSDIYKERNSAKSSTSATAAASFSDKSQGAYSNKTALSAKSTNQAAYSDKYAGNANSGHSGSSGYANGYGSAQSSGAGYSNASVASSSKGATKSTDSLKTASSTKAAYKNDVQSSASKKSSASSNASSSIDDIHMDKEQIIYKKEFKEIKAVEIQSDAAMAKLKGVLQTQFGLEFKSAPGILTKLKLKTKVNYTSYSDALNKNAKEFKDLVRAETGADFLGIAISNMGYSLKPAEDTNLYKCNTSDSSINIFSLNGGTDLPSQALKPVTSSQSSIEACKGMIRIDMANDLATTVGADIQTYLRDKNREIDSGQGAYTYTAIVQGNFDRKTRRDLEKVMEQKTDKMKGVDTIPSSSNTELKYSIKFVGNGNDAGNYILDNVQNPAFANYDIRMDADDVIVLYPRN